MGATLNEFYSTSTTKHEKILFTPLPLEQQGGFMAFTHWCLWCQGVTNHEQYIMSQQTTEKTEFKMASSRTHHHENSSDKLIITSSLLNQRARGRPACPDIPGTSVVWWSGGGSKDFRDHFHDTHRCAYTSVRNFSRIVCWWGHNDVDTPYRNYPMRDMDQVFKEVSNKRILTL